MGYTTEFSGKCRLNPALTPAQVKYINQFSGTRRMKRDADKAGAMADPVREAVGLPVGEDGEFFVGNPEDFGQNRDESVVDYNRSPATQPSLWCDWEVSENGKFLQWNGGEKFYCYTEWMGYVIDNFFKPWGVTAFGDIKWRGEDRSDRGVLVVKNNQVQALEGEDFAQYKAQKKLERQAKAQASSLHQEVDQVIDQMSNRPSRRL